MASITLDKQVFHICHSSYCAFHLISAISHFYSPHRNFFFALSRWLNLTVGILCFLAALTFLFTSFRKLTTLLHTLLLEQLFCYISTLYFSLAPHMVSISYLSFVFPFSLVPPRPVFQSCSPLTVRLLHSLSGGCILTYLFFWNEFFWPTLICMLCI